jgi:hypothetical protein
MFKFSLALLATAALVTSPAAGQAAQQCRFTLQGANVWTGERFERRDVTVDGRTFAAPGAAAAPALPASWAYLIPPWADAHTHNLKQPAEGNDPVHRRNLDQGIFYALNPSNIRRETPGAPFGADQVETIYAGAALTKPGGHPRPLEESLDKMYRSRGIDRGPLPGRAFHEVANEAEARAAVERVEASGSKMVKLILDNHDSAKSIGLTPETFRAAVAHAGTRGLRPIVHVHSAADFRLAASTPGVAALLHMPGASPRGANESIYMLTAADVALARANNITVVPTIAVAFNALTGDRLAGAQRIHAHNLRLLREGGVKLAAGADRYGATMLDEMTLLRATALFSGTELLNIATRNGLQLLYPERRIGTFEPGSEASFLILVMDPRTNWYAINEALGGFRAGEIIFDHNGLLAGLCGGAPRRQ